MKVSSFGNAIRPRGVRNCVKQSQDLFPKHGSEQDGASIFGKRDAANIQECQKA